MALFLFLQVVLLAAGYASSELKSGISVRISERGLTYVAQRVIDPHLCKYGEQFKLPASIPFAVSGFTVRLVNASFDELRMHNSSVSPSGRLMALTINKTIDVNGTALFYAKQTSWPHIGDHGLLIFNVTQLNISISLALGPGSNDTWNVSLLTSSVKVSDMKLSFHNTSFSSHILDLLTKVFKQSIIKRIQKLVERFLPTGLAYVNYKLSRFLPRVALADGFGADLSLTSRGVWKEDCYMDIQVLGSIRYKGRPYGSISGINVPEPACQGAMISIVVSKSVLQSALLALSQPWPRFTYSVKTTIQLNSSLLPIVFPDIAMHQAPGVVQVNISLARGFIKLGIDRIDTTDTAFLDMVLLKPSGAQQLEVRLNLTIHFAAAVKIRNFVKPVNKSDQAVVFEDISLNFTRLAVDSSKIGRVQTKLILQMLQAVVIQDMPQVRARGKQGVLLPPPIFVRPTHVDLKIRPGYIQVSSDVAPLLSYDTEGPHSEKPEYAGTHATMPSRLLQAVSESAHKLLSGTAEHILAKVAHVL